MLNLKRFSFINRTKEIHETEITLFLSDFFLLY